MARIPGAELIARAIDFFIGDPLHHYMEAGMLKGIKERAEGRVAGALCGNGGLGLAAATGNGCFQAC